MSDEKLRIADLHTHSTASDGMLTPAELVEVAHDRGIRVLALTDHDTTSGCSDAQRAATALAIEFVRGIEISAYWKNEEYHLLGYFVDPDARDLAAYESRMRVWRQERLEQICAQLRDAGIGVDLHVGDAENPTRSHVAHAIVDAGYATSIQEAFAQFLSPGTPGFVRAATIDVRSAIDLVRSAGGLSALAHPGDWTSEADIKLFARWGLDALEVVHPSHDDRLTEYFRALAHRLELLSTGGSDFHGVDVTARAAIGNFNIERSWYDALRQRCIRKRSRGQQ